MRKSNFRVKKTCFYVFFGLGGSRVFLFGIVVLVYVSLVGGRRVFMLRSLDFRFSWFGRLPASIPYAKLKKQRKKRADDARTRLWRVKKTRFCSFWFSFLSHVDCASGWDRFFREKFRFFSAIHIGGAAPPSKQ